MRLQHAQVQSSASPNDDEAPDCASLLYLERVEGPLLAMTLISGVSLQGHICSMLCFEVGKLGGELLVLKLDGVGRSVGSIGRTLGSRSVEHLKILALVHGLQRRISE